MENVMKFEITVAIVVDCGDDPTGYNDPKKIASEYVEMAKNYRSIGAESSYIVSIEPFNEESS